MSVRQDSKLALIEDLGPFWKKVSILGMVEGFRTEWSGEGLEMAAALLRFSLRAKVLAGD